MSLFTFPKIGFLLANLKNFQKVLASKLVAFFIFFQKVLAVHYSYAKIEVHIFAASQFSGGIKAKNSILCPARCLGNLNKGMGLSFPF